jgi:hypothetical protein
MSSHAALIMIAEGGLWSQMTIGARWLIFGLFLSKIINLNHTKDFDLQGAFIGAPKFLLKDIPEWIKSRVS